MQTDPDVSDEIRRFERQYAENPDSLVFARLADLHRKAGRAERALEILDGGLERHPDYLSAHIVRARSLRALDRPDEAETVFRRVLELDGENLVALRSLAEMAWERGDEETARERVGELLELDPRNAEARELLAEMRGAPPEGGPGGPGSEPPDREAFAWGEEPLEESGEAGEEPEASPGGTEETSVAEDEGTFVAEDDPFRRSSADEEDDFGAEDDPFRRPPSGEVDDFGAEDDPFRRPPSGGEAAAEADAEPREADPEVSRPDEPTGGRAFDLEPAEPGHGAPTPGEEAEEDEDGRWWDFLRPGGGAAEEPGQVGEGAAGEPGPAAAGGRHGEGPAAAGVETPGPAVGDAGEGRALREQIEELRMRAEQETDLSDTDEELATETLANLYEAQGFYREAVEMYEELAAQRPGDEDLRRRLDRAREALEGPPGESVVTAAEELRAVLRGEAAGKGPDADGP